MFLTAAKSIGVAPTACVVFEDAPAGVLAAKAARMTCVAVPDETDRNHRFMAIADLVLPTLESFSVAELEELDAKVTKGS